MDIYLAVAASSSQDPSVGKRLAGQFDPAIIQSSPSCSDQSLKLIGSIDGTRPRDRVETPSRGAGTSSAIQVIIPLRPTGWDNVPMVSDAGHTADQLGAIDAVRINHDQ